MSPLGYKVLFDEFTKVVTHNYPHLDAEKLPRGMPE